ncbi:hypothetical protein R1flu_001913 [Riccia fluitans]|uniref:Uncharacterized protein n=1 Tax=Riccia fluitans TaxID=41844 RepID=A0ABD1Y4W0_9MARC
MGRAPCCDKANVKRGPWSPEEDTKLKSFIEQNGTGGNWIALPRKAGLKRCGKSCRLRWINYLRPDIKHGNFTVEEEEIMYKLHSQIGSKWSKIAAELPGRTDNDIKNYWNTRLKKKLPGRGSVSCCRKLHPYQMSTGIYSHLWRRVDNMADQLEALFARRENLLHGQCLSYYCLGQQQKQYIGCPEQQHPNGFVEQNIHQPDQFSAGFLNLNKAKMNRFSEIQSGLMSIISSGESAASDSASDYSSIQPVSSMEYGYPMHASTALSYDSPTSASSVCNKLQLSPLQNVFGNYDANSFVDPGYEVYQDSPAQNPDARMVNFGNPRLDTTYRYNPAPPLSRVALLPTSGLSDNLVFAGQGLPEVGVAKADLAACAEGPTAEWWNTMDTLMDSVEEDLSPGSSSSSSSRPAGDW